MPSANAKMDLYGRRVGKLTVIKPMNERIHGKIAWLCKCDCGGTTIQASPKLRNGKINSCAACCPRHHLPQGQSSYNNIIHLYKRNARIRKLEWLLSNEQAMHLILSNCYYCDAEPRETMRANFTVPVMANGIDRKNSDGNYEIGNCVSCCTSCNHFKMAMSFDEFVSKIKGIYEHLSLSGADNQ